MRARLKNRTRPGAEGFMLEMVSRTDVPGTTAGPADFEGFYRAEYVRLVRALLLLTGDAQEAEDLAQEALARVFERWERVRSMDSPTGYLYRTALNLHRKGLRRLAVRARRPSALPPHVDAIAAAEDRLEALRAVAALPRGQREALVLVVWLDLDAEEAGRLLGITAASVRGRLYRARATLHDRSGGDDHG